MNLFGSLLKNDANINTYFIKLSQVFDASDLVKHERLKEVKKTFQCEMMLYIFFVESLMTNGDNGRAFHSVSLSVRLNEFFLLPFPKNHKASLCLLMYVCIHFAVVVSLLFAFKCNIYTSAS